MSSISDADSLDGDAARQPARATTITKQQQEQAESDDDSSSDRDAPQAKRRRKRDAEAASSSSRGKAHSSTEVIVRDDIASSEAAASSASESEGNGESESESENESESESGSSDDGDTSNFGHTSSSSQLPAASSKQKDRPQPEPLPPPPVIADDLEFDDALDAFGTEPKSHRLWPSLAGFNRLVTRWQPDRTAVPWKPLKEPPIVGNFPPSAGTVQVPLRFARWSSCCAVVVECLSLACMLTGNASSCCPATRITARSSRLCC